jgi:predicted NBD/HSP70 family sugar kinase
MSAASVGESACWLVLDVGGTNLRLGWYDPASGDIEGVVRHPVVNFLRMRGATVEQVQEALLAQLRELCAQMAAAAPRQVAAVGISFAGPVTADGLVMDAPTIWGRRGAPLALGTRLEAALGVPVHVINDVSAAAWRYAAAIDEPFCLVTVSSGVGNKVHHHGATLVNRDGYGGEIGHLRVDFAPDAPLCDCGGRGHLGAVASGRGAVEVARRQALAEPERFAASRLARLSPGGAGEITTHAIVAALEDGDDFAERCVRHGAMHMARSLAALYAAIGVRRYLFMGGFAQALGQRYLDLLAEELREAGMFGIAPDRIRGLLLMAEADDDHGLIGAGRYLASRAPAARFPTTNPSERLS